MNRALRVLSLALAAVLVLSLAGCGSDVAATVNGQKISKKDIQTQLDQLKAQYPSMFQGTDGKTRADEFYKRLLDQQINEMLVHQEAIKQGIVISDADVQKQIDDLKKNFQTDAAFNDALKKNNMTLDKLKQQERSQLESQKLLEKLTKGMTVTEAEMKAYYAKNAKSVFTTKAAVHAAHIQFDIKDQATAQKVLDQLKADPSKFAALAKQYSKDAGSASKGGDLGWPSQPYEQGFQKALDALTPGQIGPVLVKTTSPAAFHIVKVIEKRADSIRPYAQVRDQVRQVLLQQKQADAFQALLDQLKKAAKIDYAK
jgi:foldase protein PrsA